MENTGTVCTQVADRCLPRSNNHGRGQPQENVLLGRRERPSKTMLYLWKKWASKYKVATKMDKKEG